MTHDTRVPAVEPGTVPELAGLEALIRRERGGELPVLYQVLLNSPPIAAGWEQMLTAVRNQSSVPANLRELVILRVAVLNGASFEFAAHEPHARAAGVRESTIEAVRTDRLAEDVFTPDEELVLRLTDHMTREITVPADLISELQESHGVRGAVEIVATVAAYNMVSRFLVALNIVHEEPGGAP